MKGERNLRKQKKQKGEMDGYFTVEATMVLPIVLVMIVLTIYLLFFQYNRCLLEQDVGILALRGVALQADNNQDRIQLLSQQKAGLYYEKYIAWEQQEISVGIERGVLYVKGGGMVKFPFQSVIVNGEQKWEVSVSYKNHVVSPVSFIRNCRKIMGGE